MRANQIKVRIAASGQPALGGSLNVYSPHIVEVYGALGFDWVFIDCEHGVMSESEVENMVRAAEAYGITPVVRVPRNSASVILRFLDLGAMGIVVPHINSVEDAQRAPDAAKYPPLGERGSNYGTGRNNSYGVGQTNVRDYYEESNHETILFALIESQGGVDNIDEILAVPGVDGTWLGPADMALSMGMPDPSVVAAALERVVETTLRAGKISAATHLRPEDIDGVARFYEKGSRVLAVTALALLKSSASDWKDAVTDRLRAVTPS